MLGITKTDIELPALRSLCGRTFDLGNGQRNTRISTGPVHFFDKYHYIKSVGAFQNFSFDLKWDDIRRGWTFQENSFQPLIPEYADQESDFFDCFGDRETHVRMTPDCRHILGRLISVDELAAEGLETETDAPCVLYTDAFGKGIDLVYLHKRRGMSKLIRFRAGFYPTDDTHIKIEVKTTGDIYRAYKEQDIAALTATAYKLDTTKTKTFDTAKSCFIGNREQGYTIIEPFRLWERRSIVSIRQNSQFITADWLVENGKTYLVKNIPASFFTNATFDTYCDTTTTAFATQDGRRYYYGSNLTTPNWAGIVAGTGGAEGGDTAFLQIQTAKTTYYQCIRALMTFDESAVGTNTVSSASIFTYKASTGNSNTVKHGLYGASDYGTFGAGDYTAVNSTAQSNTQLTTISSGYNEWVFNSTGIGAINKTGSQYYSLREIDYDVGATAPSSNTNAGAYDTSAYAGTDHDAYISIVHAAASSIIPAAMHHFKLLRQKM